MEITDLTGRLDQIVASLRDDPVYVDRAMGNGDAESVREALRTDVDGLPYPAYVVLAHGLSGDDLPDAEATDAPAELAALIHRQLGEDALYVVGMDGRVVSFAPGVGELSVRTVDVTLSVAEREIGADLSAAGLARAHLQLADGHDDLAAPTENPAAAEVVLELSGDSLMSATTVDYSYWQARTDLTDYANPSPSAEGAVGAGIMVALAAAALTHLLLRRRDARREAIGEPTDVSVARERLDAALETLLEWDPTVMPVSVETADEWAEIWKAADAARVLHDSQDPADIVGAMVLAQHAVRTGRELSVPGGTDSRTEPRKPCFLNPMHGSSAESITLPRDRTQVRVPVCAECASAVRGDRPTDTLLVRDGRRVVPYYRRDDVWALTGYGALRDGAAEMVLAGARAGAAVPERPVR